MFESCLRNYECSEQLAKQEVTSIFRALNRNDSDTSSDTYCGSNNIVVFLTIQYYCLSLRHE